MALGIVYYMRLNNQYRKDYEQYLDKQVRLQNEVSFSEVRLESLGANKVWVSNVNQYKLLHSHSPHPAGI